MRIVAEDEHNGVWTTIVGPEGQVRHLECKTNVGGDIPCRWSPELQAPVIDKRYRDRGWCFYAEMCAAEEPRTGASEARKYAELDRRFLAILAAGNRPARGSINLERFYHPEVTRRRGLERATGYRPVSAEEGFGDLAGEIAEAQADTPLRRTPRRRRVSRPEVEVGEDV